MALVEATGVTAAVARLRRVGTAANDQYDVMERQARWTQKRIAGVPVASGLLARSVAGGANTYRHVSAESFAVGTTVAYAHFVFGGTRHMPARPPRIPDPGPATAQAIAADIDRRAR